jgi:transposase
MPKRLDFTLTESELAEIEQAIRSEQDANVRQRATALRMLHLGYSASQVAENMAVELPTIYSWHHRRQADGIEGLRNRPKSGRPRHTDESYEKRLGEIVEIDPETLGYAFVTWTIDRLRQHMQKETGIRLSASRFRALMKRLGYEYRQPNHDLSALQDAEAHERSKELLSWLKKTPSVERSNSSLWTKQP